MSARSAERGAPVRRVAWGVIGIVLGAGVLFWAAHLVLTLVLVRSAATFYPGTIRTIGGEYDGWIGPGWEVGRTWCYGTTEMCADHDSSPFFTFLPGFAVFCLVVWAGVSVGVGLVVSVVRRRRSARGRAPR